MCYRTKRFHGVTLMELIISILMGVILILGAGVLLVADQKAWNQTYASAFGAARQDSRAATATFYRVAMASGSVNYKIYRQLGPLYTESKGSPVLTQAVYGDAVEFRYGNSDYAFFYTQKDGDNTQLKVEYGTVSRDGSGAVAKGGIKKPCAKAPVVLANYVEKQSPVLNGLYVNNTAKLFRHSAVNGMGQGCVALRLALKDPDRGTVYTTITAVAMRNNRVF